MALGHYVCLFALDCTHWLVGDCMVVLIVCLMSGWYVYLSGV